MKRIEEIATKQLRHRAGNYETDDDVDPLDIISIVKEVIQDQVDQIKTTKRLLQNGDPQAMSNLVESYHDARLAAKVASDSPSLSDGQDDGIVALALSSMPKDLDIAEVENYSLEELASWYIDDDTVNYMEKTVSMLEDAERMLNQSPKQHRRTSNTSKKDRLLSNSASTFSIPDKKHHSKLPRLKAAQKLRAKKSANSANNNRHLQEQISQCQSCEEEDFQCNCQRLVTCAKDLTWYDLSAMLLGGFVSVSSVLTVSNVIFIVIYLIIVYHTI